MQFFTDLHDPGSGDLVLLFFEAFLAFISLAALLDAIGATFPFHALGL